MSDEQKEADVTDYLEGLSVTERAAAYTAMMSVPSEEYLSAIVDQQMGSLDRASIEQMVISTYAQQMSVDEATVKSYIAQMDDETLFGYVEQSIREQVTEQYAAGVQARLSNMTSDQLAMALDLALEKSPAVTPLTSEQYNWLYDNYMPATVSNGTYEDNLKLLGDVDLASPKTINIYASTFADKDAIADAIEQYNNSVSEDDQIDYTDYVALLMSSVTTIINAISYVLIAFVAISLVVSSIMIGIITYISVLERTKEIGILREQARHLARVQRGDAHRGLLLRCHRHRHHAIADHPHQPRRAPPDGYREPERHPAACRRRGARGHQHGAHVYRGPHPLRHRRAQGPCRSAAHRITRYLTFKKDVFRRKTSFFSFTAILQKATF